MVQGTTSQLNYQATDISPSNEICEEECCLTVNLLDKFVTCLIRAVEVHALGLNELRETRVQSHLTALQRSIYEKPNTDLWWGCRLLLDEKVDTLEG
ncbi:hypothetical protein F2Q69_00001802 [Brassica cretica]|uniref:Uncharacterized protein n=1 Tax=Brassica cretica TaxID=69181 RepID=A0A8S9NW41_BRACR|nr:hypothetical protein F2Q69_00001802 [Brassica cretica]